MGLTGETAERGGVLTCHDLKRHQRFSRDIDNTCQLVEPVNMLFGALTGVEN
jgi:hypothetical protein